jgi:hypothetical protein
LLQSPESTRSSPRHKARAKALSSPCGVTSFCLADDNYIAASFTSVEASLKSLRALVLLFFLLSFWCIYGCAIVCLVLGRVVVFSLVDMPQSSPYVGATVLI